MPGQSSEWIWIQGLTKKSFTDTETGWCQHGSLTPAVTLGQQRGTKASRDFQEAAMSQEPGLAPAGCALQPRPGRCRAALQTLEAIAECAGPCQVTERGNHGEFTRFFAVCIKNVIRHNAMRRPLYQQQQQAQRTKKRIWLGRGTSLHTSMSEVVPVKLSWRGEKNEKSLISPQFKTMPS